MTTPSNTIQRLFEGMPAWRTAPAALDGVIAELDSSGGHLDLAELNTAARQDLQDVPSIMKRLDDVSAEAVERLASRLAWTVERIASWHPQQDPKLHALEGALASVAWWGGSTDFWQALHSRLSSNSVVLKAFQFLIDTRDAEATPADDAPIWEREHLSATRAAEAKGDWPELAIRIRAWPSLPCMDPGARQAMIGLCVSDWPGAVAQANRATEWLKAAMLVEAVPLVYAMRLATVTRNAMFRFGVLDRLCRFGGSRLSAMEETALTLFFIALSRDRDDWPKWLAVFNEYPVRHPHLQFSLGRALARGDEAVLSAYVDSLVLDGSSDEGGRSAVTTCLEAFRDKAGPARRNVLWHSAFRRWTEWDFGRSKDGGLNDVVRTLLDYAIVGWLVEGELGEITAEDAFVAEMEMVETEWHPSVISAVSGHYRALSRYQVRAHAEKVRQDSCRWLPLGDWLMPHWTSDGFAMAPYVRRAR
jgi:hypothetical protein